MHLRLDFLVSTFFQGQVSSVFIPSPGGRQPRKYPFDFLDCSTDFVSWIYALQVERTTEDIHFVTGFMRKVCNKYVGRCSVLCPGASRVGQKQLSYPCHSAPSLRLSSPEVANYKSLRQVMHWSRLVTCFHGSDNPMVSSWIATVMLSLLTRIRLRGFL